jgi:16S rRNA (guanine527-N7)-methyltransferase
MRWSEQLMGGLEQMALQVSAGQQQRLLDYLELLNKWNKTYNLTAVRNPNIMVSRQLLDSLSIQSLLQGERILDVGSGAGLPGIPLAIVNPEKSFTLLDTNSKKTRFLIQVKLELGLKNLRIEQIRVEQYRPEALFHCITSRAFAALPDMINLTRHLLAADGLWVAMKAGVPERELSTLSGVSHDPHHLTVPGESGERQAILLWKNQ